MSIILKTPESWYQSCPVTLVQILTGWSFERCKKEILLHRKKKPRDNRGFRCKPEKIHYSTEYAYIDEIQAILKSIGYDTKFVYPKSHMYNYDFYQKHRSGTYVVNSTDHCYILHEGKTYDNGQWDFGKYATYYRHRYDAVVSYSKIS